MVGIILPNDNPCRNSSEGKTDIRQGMRCIKQLASKGKMTDWVSGWEESV